MHSIDGHRCDEVTMFVVFSSLVLVWVMIIQCCTTTGHIRMEGLEGICVPALGSGLPWHSSTTSHCRALMHVAIWLTADCETCNFIGCQNLRQKKKSCEVRNQSHPCTITSNLVLTTDVWTKWDNAFTKNWAILAESAAVYVCVY